MRGSQTSNTTAILQEGSNEGDWGSCMSRQRTGVSRPFSYRARRYESHIAAEGIYPHKDEAERKADSLLSTSFIAATGEVLLKSLSSSPPGCGQE